MRCHWQELINLLPGWLREPVDRYGKDDMQELRLRIDMPPEIKTSKGSQYLERAITKIDIEFCLNMATRYSPWTSSGITQGYITAIGGHRIGICGECIYDGDKFKNIGSVTSLCIRVAREYQNVSGNLYLKKGSYIIIGCPGSGKTTFLRDLIRKISNQENGAIVVIDERRELFPQSAGKFLFERGHRTDVLSGCKKEKGLEMAIRTMSPTVVAVDEITDPEDCNGLCRAARCGVRLLATAHAGTKEEFFSRPIYKPLFENRIFDGLIWMYPDKSWQEEKIT